MLPKFNPQRLPDWLAAVEARPGARWLIDPFLAEDSLTIVSGVPKRSHKTWLAMGQCLALASGKAVGPFQPVRQVPVLYCYHEGADKAAAARFRMLQNGYGIEDRLLADFWFSHRALIDLRDPADVARIVEICRVNQIGVVVLDTLAKSMLGDEDKAENMGRVIRGVEAIRGSGASVIFLHHLRKSVQPLRQPVDIDVDLRGSSSLAGAYETHQAVRFTTIGESVLLVENKDSQPVGCKHKWEFRENKTAILHAESLLHWDDLVSFDENLT